MSHIAHTACTASLCYLPGPRPLPLAAAAEEALGVGGAGALGRHLEVVPPRVLPVEDGEHALGLGVVLPLALVHSLGKGGGISS